MKTLTIIDKFKDYWNNYLPLSKRQAITWLLKIEKELKALEIIKNYIHVDKPFGNACYIYLNDESEMISEETYNLLKGVGL